MQWDSKLALSVFHETRIWPKSLTLDGLQRGIWSRVGVEARPMEAKPLKVVKAFSFR